MYRPRPFRIDDVAWCRALAADQAFATVVAAAGGHDVGPARVGHAPVVQQADGLSFHVARDNPLADLGVGDQVLFVFVGPHAHVSGKWYAQPDRQVPTWDYEAVHATGLVVEVLDLDGARGHVAQVASTFEGEHGWSLEDAPAHSEQLLPGLRAFRVEVQRWEGLAKLSQNKSPEDRRRVGMALRASPDAGSQHVGARVLEELGGDTEPSAISPVRAGPSLDDFELRLPTPDDADIVVEAIRRSADLLRGWTAPPTSRDEYASWLERGDLEANRRYLVFFRDELVGNVNLQNIVRGGGQFTTLGYLAFVPHAGRGLLRRAVALGVDLAFGDLELHRVEAGVQPTNTASLNLVRALGFQFEGVLRRLVQVEGEWRDHELWAMIVDDWPGARALFPD